MSTTFEPKYVPSDVISRWPGMALELWKRSFSQQAGILLAAALLIKFLPGWSEVIGFLIAPSLFIISFAAAERADEYTKLSWGDLLQKTLPGALRLGYMSLQFATIFGLVIGALSLLASSLLPASSAAEQEGLLEQASNVSPLLSELARQSSTSLPVEFLHFCATWAAGVMSMMFLGLFIVAIYQGIFGVVLHARQEMSSRESRAYSWRAWQVNAESIETALRDAPSTFFNYVGMIIVAVICGFQTVYLSPVGLIVATYIPCLAYVAYRSIFCGKHENVAEAKRVAVAEPQMLVPVKQSY